MADGMIWHRESGCAVPIEKTQCRCGADSVYHHNDVLGGISSVWSCEVCFAMSVLANEGW